MARLNVSDYDSALEPSEEFFKDWFALADVLGGTVGLTREGGLVISLVGSSNDDAVAVSAGISNDDFPHCYVIAGTDSVLIPDLS